MVNYPHLMFTGTYSEMVKEQRIKETEERQKDREEAEREGCGVQNKAVYIVVTSCIMVYGGHFWRGSVGWYITGTFWNVLINAQIVQAGESRNNIGLTFTATTWSSSQNVCECCKVLHNV